MTTPEEIRFGSRPSIEEFARQLAQSHRDEEQGEATIYVSWEDDEVRLVEIADRNPASTEPLPFHFAAQPERDFPYPVVILMVNADAWSEATDKEELLPAGWTIDKFVLLEDLEER